MNPANRTAIRIGARMASSSATRFATRSASRIATRILPFAALLAVVLCSPALARGSRPHPSKLTYPAMQVTTPQSEEISLSNGLTGFLVEDHEIPVVDLVLLVRTYYPAKEKYGVNDMARWVMRNGGSAAWPGDRLNDELEFMAARVEIWGSDLNTQISCSCMKRDLPKVLEILADLVEHPTFPEEKVEMKRKTMLEEVRRRNDQPDEVGRREYAALLYGDHPYSWRTSTKSVSAITRDDLVGFHSAWFHPNNAILGVSGDVTKEEITSALEQALGGWAPAEVVVPVLPPLAEDRPAGVHYIEKDVNQAYIQMGHLGVNSNDPDRCAMDIANFILGGGSFTSWITEKVRNDEGLAYSASSRFGSDPFARGIFTASAQTKAEACGRAMTIMRELITRMQEQGPTAEEVKNAVDSYVNSQVFDYESKAQVVRRLVQLKFEGRPLDTPQRDMEAYSKMTVEDVRRAAKAHLRADRLTLLVVGDAKQFDRPLSDWGTVDQIQLRAE